MDLRKLWPQWLFWSTLGLAILSTAVSIRYALRVSALQKEGTELSRLQEQNEKHIKELKERNVVRETESIPIPTPIVKPRERILGPTVSPPEIRVEQRNVKRATEVNDPTVRPGLDAKFEEIKELSARAKETQTEIPRVSPIHLFAARLFFSFAFGIASFYIILSHYYKAEQDRFAFGTLGTILGFWLGNSV